VIERWAILPDLFFGAGLPDVGACRLVADEPSLTRRVRIARDFYFGPPTRRC